MCHKYLVYSRRLAAALRRLRGNITLAKSYEPYGTVLTSTPLGGAQAAGTASSIFGYAGEQADTTGLIYLRARYLNPRLGIFLARDPWSGDQLRPGSMNGWNYTEANPINRVDPSGWQSNPPQCPPSHPILRVDRSLVNNHMPPLYWCEDSNGHAVKLDGSPLIYSGTVYVGPDLSGLVKAIGGLIIFGYICFEAVAHPGVQVQPRSEPRAGPTVIPWPIERTYPTEEPKARPPVVVQLQEGFTHHDSRQLKDFGGGVTAAQVVGALTELLQHPSITKKYKSWAEVAYSNAIAWTTSRPPYGAPPNFPKGQSFPFPKFPDWRFDIVIYIGQQLRR
jgi:RHS repeat-associated protein